MATTGDYVMMWIFCGIIFGPMLIILGLLFLAMAITVAKAFGIVIWDILQDIWAIIRGKDE